MIFFKTRNEVKRKLVENICMEIFLVTREITLPPSNSELRSLQKLTKEPNQTIVNADQTKPNLS